MILVIEVAPQIEFSWTVDCRNSGSSQTLELLRTLRGALLRRLITRKQYHVELRYSYEVLRLPIELFSGRLLN